MAAARERVAAEVARAVEAALATERREVAESAAMGVRAAAEEPGAARHAEARAREREQAAREAERRQMQEAVRQVLKEAQEESSTARQASRGDSGANQSPPSSLSHLDLPRGRPPAEL